jgi:hypothetical protein
MYKINKPFKYRAAPNGIDYYKPKNSYNAMKCDDMDIKMLNMFESSTRILSFTIV